MDLIKDDRDCKKLKKIIKEGENVLYNKTKKIFRKLVAGNCHTLQLFPENLKYKDLGLANHFVGLIVYFSCQKQVLCSFLAYE